MSRPCLAAFAAVLALIAGPRLPAADPDLAGDPVTDAELDAARTAKVGCKDLDRASNESPFRTKTLRAITVKACKRDRWALGVVVCFLRDRGDACEERLPKRALARYRKAVDKASSQIMQEERLWAIETARAAGVLGTGTAGAFDGLHAAATEGERAGDPPPPPPESGSSARRPPPPPPPDPRAGAKAAIEAWAQPAYSQCTDSSRNLAIEVTIAGDRCTDARVLGERRTSEASRCLKAVCAGAEWAGTPDITWVARVRPPAAP